MKIEVRYYTRSGNTKKLADAIAASVGTDALDVSQPISEKVDILFLGSSVYAGGVDEAVNNFIYENASRIGRIVNFSTAAMPKSTYKQVKKLADANGIILIDEEFFCKGSFLFMNRNRPNSEDLAAAADFAKKTVKKYSEK